MLLSKNKKLRLLCGVLETMNLLSLKLAWKNRTNLRSFSGKMFRDYMSLVKEDRWLSQSLFEIFPEVQEARVTFEHFAEPNIHTPLDDLARLAAITKLVAPRKVFEIGTFRGRTALNFALNSPSDCLVYTLDLPPEEKPLAKQRAFLHDARVIDGSRPGLHYRGKDVSAKIVQLWGDSQRFDFTPYFGQIDLVYVDGAHHYEAVRQDTLNALQMLSPTGVLLWDDFADYGNQNDVTRAVLDLLPGNEVIQVDHTHIALYRPKREAANTEAVPVKLEVPA